MNALVLYCSKTPEFKREALKFQAYHDVPKEQIHDFSQYSKARRPYEVANWLAKKVYIDIDFDIIAIFCHGLKGSNELGMTMNNLELFRAVTFCRWKTYVPNIIMYSCSCGKKGGLAQALSAKYGEFDISNKVISHTTSGHTTMNPNVAYYSNGEDVTPDLIKKRGSEFLTFARMLSDCVNFRFAFPGMDYYQLWKEVKPDAKELIDKMKIKIDELYCKK